LFPIKAGVGGQAAETAEKAAEGPIEEGEATTTDPTREGMTATATAADMMTTAAAAAAAVTAVVT
jgi:hypothetical protein